MYVYVYNGLKTGTYCPAHGGLTGFGRVWSPSNHGLISLNLGPGI